MLVIYFHGNKDDRWLLGELTILSFRGEAGNISNTLKLLAAWHLFNDYHGQLFVFHRTISQNVFRSIAKAADHGRSNGHSSVSPGIP